MLCYYVTQATNYSRWISLKPLCHDIRCNYTHYYKNVIKVDTGSNGVHSVMVQCIGVRGYKC